MKFKAILIPDVGEAIPTRLFKVAVDCQAHARTKAQNLLKNNKANYVEIVTLDGQTAIDHEFLAKKKIVKPFYVMYETYGGLIASSRGPLKKEGKVILFPDFESADLFAKGVQKTKNSNPHRKTNYRYWTEEYIDDNQLPTNS